MPRAIWTGSLSFGLVNIPIEVHTAVRDHRPHFRMLHAKDRSPINFERICQKDGKSVAWDDIVKGYEYEKGHFVVLGKEDFAAAALEKTRRIDVLDFVEADAIDDRYFDKPYYLTAKKGGEVAYALLREAMNESGRIGIAKFIMRETQHLAAVEGIGDALVLSTLRFADELVEHQLTEFPERQEPEEDGAQSGKDISGEPRRRVGSGQVQGRLPGESDASDQSQDERKGSEARYGRAPARLERDRSHGAAESEPSIRQRPDEEDCTQQDAEAYGPRAQAAAQRSRGCVTYGSLMNRWL